MNKLPRKLGRRITDVLVKPRERDFERVMTLHLSPIPAWEGRSANELTAEFGQLRQEILDEHWEARANVRPNWKRRLTDKRQRGFRPAKTKKSKRPKFHAVTSETWLLYVKNWENWLTQYERASSRLKKGVVAALGEFPSDCFLPTCLLPSEAIQRFPNPPP